ncbi:WSC-domain-containing protein [Coprinopsis marcescibilis]|uniref:WSC-domain-containing protein n=1 Tax=Coprinopsis marcescibilis TaxID=230819 RepID=A0A5C3KWQ3_COPMA|nr:WSC-domain-containing protein [Coprinopsis marcescibilis]
MTIEKCIEICEAADYNLAGVEYGHCDSVVQSPGTQVEDEECTMPCAGDPTQLCGGPSRINVFDSGNPAPEIIQAVEAPGQGTWNYTGCYTDSAASRTLGFGITIPGGATIESCSAACTASTAGPFAFAGVENRHECWCGNALGEVAEVVEDSACFGVCTAEHQQFCGNANRILVYEFHADADPTPVCENTDIGNFTLVAEYKNPVEDGPISVNLKVIAVEISRGVVWTLLSVRLWIFLTWKTC